MGAAVDARPDRATPLTRARPSGADLAVHAAAALALLGLATVSLRTGGRDRGAVLLGLAALVPALVVLRPRVPWLAAAVPGAALLSCLVAPRGWAGAGDVALWTYAVLLWATARAYAARVPSGRAAAALGVAALGVHQLWYALTAWLGGSPDQPMIGTFYWHNQLAVWCAAAALAGGTAALLSRRWAALGGGAAFVLGGTAVVLSTSRATLGLTVLLWLALGLTALRRNGFRAVGRWAALSLAVPAAATMLTSSLVFPGAGGSALGATQQRGAAESATGNAAYRLDYWRAAVAVTAGHPLTGTGAGGFRSASFDHLPAGMPGSPYAHNAVLQAFAEGGLPFGLALVAATGAALLLAVRRRPDWPTVALGAAALVLVGHALVDFDTSYAALPALGALTLGAAARAPRERRAALPVAALAVLAVTGLTAAQADDAARATVNRVNTARDTATARAALARTPHDPRVATAALLAALPERPGQPLRFPDDVARKALAQTAKPARVDATLALQRLAVRAALGDGNAPDEAARIVANRVGRRPLLLTFQADVLDAAHRHADAVALLAAAIQQRATPAYGRPQVVWTLVADLWQREGGTNASCAAYRAEQAFGPPPPGLDLPARRACG